MSDEYLIRVNSPLSVERLKRSLGAFGLEPMEEGPTFATFAYESTDPSQVAKWGGNVVVEETAEGFKIFLNAVARRKDVLRAVIDAFERDGIACEAVEL